MESAFLVLAGSVVLEATALVFSLPSAGFFSTFSVAALGCLVVNVFTTFFVILSALA